MLKKTSKRLNFNNTVQAERSAVVEKQPDKCVPKGRDIDVSDGCGQSYYLK